MVRSHHEAQTAGVHASEKRMMNPGWEDVRWDDVRLDDVRWDDVR